MFLSFPSLTKANVVLWKLSTYRRETREGERRTYSLLVIYPEVGSFYGIIKKNSVGSLFFYIRFCLCVFAFLLHCFSFSFFVFYFTLIYFSFHSSIPYFSPIKAVFCVLRTKKPGTSRERNLQRANGVCLS